jgi:hypothetical protein
MGDADASQTVDTVDFNILAANFGVSGGVNFASADFNYDDVVDTVDFNLLASSFSASGKNWQDGDFNFDGTVDTVDFNLLASNFGKAALPAGSDGLGALVPEPTAVSLVAIGAVAGLSQRRRRTK